VNQIKITPYHAKYYAYELTKRNSSDSIQKLVTSLMDAQGDLNPHQVETALFAFRSPLSTGAISFNEKIKKDILNPFDQKVSAQREIKDMEKKRSELRRNLFLAQDEVDKRKEKIIENIEARLQQKIETKELFTFRWRLL